MNPEVFIELAHRTLYTALILAAPPLIAGLVVGVAVSLVQAVTQMQEQTLVLVPKLVIVSVVLVLCLPWMLQVLLHFTTTLFSQLPQYIR